MAVTGTITITTLLFFYFARHRGGRPLWLVLAAAVLLLAVDLLFFAANLTKLPHGAWLPLLIAHRRVHGADHLAEGPRHRHDARGQDEGPLREFVDELRAADPPLYADPGHRGLPQPRQGTAPLALRANVEHNRVLHEHVVILAIQTAADAARPGRADGSRSTTSATATTASPTSRPPSATWTPPTCPSLCR